MFRFSQGTLVTAVILWFWAPGILPMTITGPSSGQSNGIVTFTWTSDSSDPTIFEIDIDQALNSLNQSDPYWIIQDLSTSDGSATFTLPVLSVGIHRIAFSSNDGFQILDEGSIEILPASSSIPSSSSPGSSPNVAPPASKPPVSSTGASASHTSFVTPTSFITRTSSSSQSSSTQSQTSTSEAQKSVSPSPAATSAIPQSSSTQSQPSTQSQAATSGSQSVAIKHRSNTGAIAGGVVGGAVVILLALLGWWYCHRRSGSAAAGESHSDISARPLFLAAPISSALTGARAEHNGSNNHEFRPWEDNDTTAGSSAATPASATTGVTTRKQPIFMYPDHPAVDSTQPDHGPSREELLAEVQRLRAHIDAVSPPSYSGD